VTHDDVRRFAISLPEAIEAPHHGRPSFRVGKRIFATLPEAGQAVLKLSDEEQGEMVENFPEAFSLPGGWAKQGWTRVQLAEVDGELFVQLLTHSWRGVAPKRAAAKLDGAG
jgi:hypothetical protein